MSTGTQISDMTDALTSLPDGAFVPFVVTDPATGLNPTKNYRYNAGQYLAKYSRLIDTDGDGLIGSDDGASGSLWATVAGFITYLRASLGSAIVGFIQSGTGAVVRTIQDKLRDTPSATDFGVVGDGTTNYGTEFGRAVTEAAAGAGTLVLTTATNVGSTRPSMKGVQLLGNKPAFYQLGFGYGKTIANRRGRDLAQKVLGQAYLCRLWNFLQFFGVGFSATAWMTGDSVTASYVGPILRTYMLGVPGFTSVLNNAIGGTTIEQWRTGTGFFAASGKAMSDWLGSPTDFLYIDFGINTPYYGGTPADFAHSLDLALTTIRQARDVTETSIIVLLPIASKDGGAMSIEGGYKRDEYYVYLLRELCEPLVDKHQICLYDQSLETPEADADDQGVNAPIWLADGVHPIFGNKYYVAGKIFDAIVPQSLRNQSTSLNGTANVVPGTGFSLPGAGEDMRTVRRDDQIISDGYVTMDTPAMLGDGDPIATVVSGWEPLRYQRYVVLQLFRAGPSWETIRGEIDNSTRIIHTGSVSVMSPDRIYCYGAWNAA